MSKKNHGFKTTIDLVELSDAFRRHAVYKDPVTVRELVREARRFSALSTWYDAAETFRHRDLTDSLRHSVTRMADLAVKLGSDAIELPITGDLRSPIAAFIRRKVLSTLDLPVKVTLQKGQYNKDLSDLGPIDRRIKTPIDEGVRGLANIRPGLKAHW